MAWRLIVVRDQTGDVTVEFDGYSWDPQADILAAISGRTQQEAVRDFVEQLTGDSKVILVSTVPHF